MNNKTIYSIFLIGGFISLSLGMAYWSPIALGLGLGFMLLGAYNLGSNHGDS